MLNRVNWLMILIYIIKIKIDNLVLFPNNKLIFYIFKFHQNKTFFNDISLTSIKYDEIINYLSSIGLIKK